jgi:hypothetical protein
VFLVFSGSIDVEADGPGSMKNMKVLLVDFLLAMEGVLVG